jgi:hypothetical protein
MCLYRPQIFLKAGLGAPRGAVPQRRRTRCGPETRPPCCAAPRQPGLPYAAMRNLPTSLLNPHWKQPPIARRHVPASFGPPVSPPPCASPMRHGRPAFDPPERFRLAVAGRAGAPPASIPSANPPRSRRVQAERPPPVSRRRATGARFPLDSASRIAALASLMAADRATGRGARRERRTSKEPQLKGQGPRHPHRWISGS